MNTIMIHYELKDLIKFNLEEQLKEKKHKLPKEEKDIIVTALLHFVNSAIAKYINGNKEHGGNLESRDLPMEIYNETIDLFWYNNAMKLKKG